MRDSLLARGPIFVGRAKRWNMLGSKHTAARRSIRQQFLIFVEDRLPDSQLVPRVVAQVVPGGRHDVEEGPIMAVRCQYELGHLLISRKRSTHAQRTCSSSSPVASSVFMPWIPAKMAAPGPFDGYGLPLASASFGGSTKRNRVGQRLGDGNHGATVVRLPVGQGPHPAGPDHSGLEEDAAGTDGDIERHERS